VSRPVLWLSAFVGLIILFGVLIPITRSHDWFFPATPAVLAASWGMRVLLVGFGAALASGAARSRGYVSLGVLVVSALLAAHFGFYSFRFMPWIRPLVSVHVLMNALPALRPVGQVWLGAVLYELARWRPR